MDENIISDNLRERLISAGLSELEKHGIEDFSLRRVALSAGVSCAAPYRHFKDKDELILAIIEYVLDGWILLSEQIYEACCLGTAECVIELCTSLVRFWVGNGNFRSLLTLAGTDKDPNRHAKLLEFDRPISYSLAVFSAVHLLTDEDNTVLVNTVLSLIYGTLFLISRGSDAEMCITNLRSKIITEFTTYF